MKLTISFPATGCQELTEGAEGHSLRSFYDKRVATEVAADAPGEERRGMWFTWGWEQGVPVAPGVLSHGCVCMLLSKGRSWYRPRYTGERAPRACRKQRGERHSGLTDATVPCRLGPSRAGRTCKLSSLSREDQVRQQVVRKPLNKEGQNLGPKPPGSSVLQHRRRRVALEKQRTKKNKEEATEYAQLLAKRMKGDKEKGRDQMATRPGPCRGLRPLRLSPVRSEIFLRAANKIRHRKPTNQPTKTNRQSYRGVREL